MGASSSKDTELDNALSKFDEGERDVLTRLFDSLSRETHLDKTAFKVGIIKLGKLFVGDNFDKINKLFIHTHFNIGILD